MRRAVFAAIALASIATGALAKDFIVVSSSDPAVKTGQALDAGVHLAIAPGHSVTLMRPSGEIVTVRGGANGAVVPGQAAASVDDTKFAAVQALFTRPPSGRAFGARRGFCPGPEVLDNVDAIVRSYESGCKADARKAFLDYLKAHGVSAADADQLYVASVVGPSDEEAAAH